ncbi:DUF6161 domain-containing protein [Flavivirga spongiicola]|uniref:DUF6161 domain-containing protein n=1 Tax=Flavivirga spongiicola TaxID=421621 RepID=A0ABU7XT50_9FLAO|nr:DUF6161 domain-containing protein [Flavivirga sp. MEBiC05379]MDO5978939.1 DUF6161 domain-containing protein [Flavivirga sp. MEBiC05379]
MTQTEFRKKISQTTNTKWFNSVEIDLSYPHLNLNFEFKGFGQIHRFVSQQIKGWEKLSENLPNELLASKTYFEFVEGRLISFLESYGNEEEANLQSFFGRLKNQIQGRTGTNFTYDCPETEFLIDVYKSHTKSFIGAYTYVTGNLNQNIAIRDNFNGYLLAYEFTLKDSTLITERRNKEKSALSKLRSDFQNSLPKLDSELVEHLKNSTKKYEEFGIALDEFKEEKEKTYSDWFINTKGEYEEFSNNSDERIKDLEETYQEKLKLEEPALYWSDRAKKLKKQGWLALVVLVGLVLIVVFSLGKLLWTTPEQIYESFFNGDKSAAIRWSIIYITFISFMAFVIRAVTKVMFSSFHLARDCEERYTLTYFYLSLLKDSKVEKEDKQLIMQALFSRAETGLLKDDSSPTMPNDIVGKFMSK